MNQLGLENELTNPEFGLLIHLLNGRFQSKRFIDCSYHIPHSFDWQYFLDIIKFHKILPLVYQCIKETNSATVPEEVLSYLRKQSFVIAVNNSFHASELLKIINLFNRYQIPVIPFKGPLLAQLAYGDLNFRQFCDLDIWVKKQDYDKAITLLLDLGYLSPYLRQTWKRSIFLHGIVSFHHAFMAHELPLGRKKSGTKLFIDLHKKISKYCNLPFDELFQNLRSLTIQESQIWTFPVEESLIVMCIHGSQDGWNKLQNICDIAYLIHKNSVLDWNTLVYQSKKAYCFRRLLLGLALAQIYFGIHLPNELYNAIDQDAVLPKLIQWIINRFNQHPRTKRTLLSKYKILNLKISMLERLIDRIMYLLDFAWFFLFSKFHRITRPDHHVLKVV